MPSSIPRALDTWLRLPDHSSVPAAWVPGLDESERRALHAAGGVARSLLDAAQVTSLPEDVRAWIGDGENPPEDAMVALRAALKSDPDGVLASLYSTLVRAEHRRQLGTFFTPSAEVKLMLDLWSDTEGDAPGTVIDVGAGVGVFTAEAAKRWPDARVLAVDINPVTLGLLAVRLFGDGFGITDSVNERVELVLADFTSWLPSSDAPTPGGRLILGNPPYTRAQLLSMDDRTRLHELTDRICGVRASLSTLITALTLKHLAPTDGLSLLLPAQWLESEYARKLRSEMWSLTRRRVELRLVESEDLFGGAQVDAVALLIGKEAHTPQMFRVAPWRSGAPVALDRTEDLPSSWRPLFDSRDSNATPVDEDSIPLGDLANVRRGVATGANAVFVVSTTDALTLPKEATVPVVVKLNELPDRLTHEIAIAAPDRALRRLLTLSREQVVSNEVLRAIVKDAEDAHIDDRVLCASRKDWFDLRAEVRYPDVVVGAMTQDRFRFVTNEIGATITNNLYGLTWHAHVGDEARARVLDWLRSDTGQAALANVARRQGAGLLKLEPGGLRRMPIPLDVVQPGHGTADGTPASSALVGRAT
ncbi:MAG: class I SAM-dependent methyltransferase [Microbacterium sp.]